MPSTLTRLTAVPALLSVALLAGCNNSTSTSASSTGAASASSSSSSTSDAAAASSSTTAAATSTAGATDTASTTGINCPTSNTRSFAKTRFVTDIGLTVGTFHRWIWKPYQAGTFNKGANGRVTAIAKAVGIAALDLHLMNNARKNVEANPTLCKVLAKPIDQAVQDLGQLKNKVTSGDLGSLAAVESNLAGIMNLGNKHGLGITETTDQSLASQG